MKVNHTDGNHVHHTHGSRKSSHASKARESEGAARSGGAEAAIASGDVKSDISSRAKEMSHAKAAAHDAPDVREAKIAELKKRIAEGHYHIKPDAIADRMVDEHLKAGIG